MDVTQEGTNTNSPLPVFPEENIVAYFISCWLRSSPLGHGQVLACAQLVGTTQNQEGRRDERRCVTADQELGQG